MAYKLKLKDGQTIIKLRTTKKGGEGQTDRQEVTDRIRELMDDQYEVTEYVKEMAIADLRKLVKEDSGGEANEPGI